MNREFIPITWKKGEIPFKCYVKYPRIGVAFAVAFAVVVVTVDITFGISRYAVLSFFAILCSLSSASLDNAYWSNSGVSSTHKYFTPWIFPWKAFRSLVVNNSNSFVNKSSTSSYTIEAVLLFVWPASSPSRSFLFAFPSSSSVFQNLILIY